MIKSIEESEEDVQEPEEENTQEDLQSINSMTHALADHANPQAAKVEESLKQQPVTILIETRSTNNFINSKVAAQLMLQDEDCSMFDIEVADGQILKYDRRCPRVKLDHPKLRIRKGSNTWYQSNVLGISLPSHSHPSAPYSHLKQFPQLLKDRHQIPPLSTLLQIIL
ncbi:hypothetical protein BHM03_00026953 [Ensete ventricosum]|uniref:Uncharacterized protein n=1 Tax=Ensete ventricosum TaxID=4639 RepID=A0A445MHJ9_ENSVE|nr:hypothetical protein BHM03_00026953 [Ensete ventricosum]